MASRCSLINIILIYFAIGFIANAQSLATISYPRQEHDDIIANTDLTSEESFKLLKVIDSEIRQKLSNIQDDSGVIEGPIDISLNHEAITLNGTIDHFSMTNLLDADIGFFCVKNSQLEIFNLTFRNISMKGNYDITGNIGGLFDIFGDGAFWMNMIKFSVSMPLKKEITTDSVEYFMDLLINVEGIDSQFDNFMHDDELEKIFNKAIRYILPQALVIFWEEYKQGFHKQITEVIKGTIEEHREILQLISLNEEPTKNKKCIFLS